MNGKKRIIINIALTYIGTVVGAGFASGKEIVEFFTRFGALGFLSILLSGLFFILGGIKLMVISKRIHAKSYQDLNLYLFGPLIGQIVNWLFLIILIGTTSVMLSGAGAVFNEQLGLSYYFGIALTLLLCFLVIMKGIKSIFAVNSVVVPMMILFSAVLAFSSIDALQALFSPKAFSNTTIQWEFFVTPFTYAALNIGLAQAVLVPIAGEIKDETTLKWGGFFGGLGLTIILLFSHIALSSLPHNTLYNIPMAEIVKLLGNSIFYFFILIIYGEIFTTLIGNFYGLKKQLTRMVPLSNKVIIPILFLLITMISHFGYGSLVSILYPVFGYVSLTILFVLMIKSLPKE